MASFVVDGNFIVGDFLSDVGSLSTDWLAGVKLVEDVIGEVVFDL